MTIELEVIPKLCAKLRSRFTVHHQRHTIIYSTIHDSRPVKQHGVNVKRTFVRCYVRIKLGFTKWEFEWSLNAAGYDLERFRFDWPHLVILQQGLHSVFSGSPLVFPEVLISVDIEHVCHLFRFPLGLGNPLQVQASSNGECMVDHRATE